MSYNPIWKWTIPLFILVGCLILWPRQAERQLPEKKISGIVFLDPSHGFVQLQTLAHPETYETLDGGQTWKEIDDGVPGFRTGRSFASKSKGWSIEENSENPSTDRHDTVSVSEDGGRTWVVSFRTGHEGDFTFGGIQALSETQAWVVGGSGAYLTKDGGKTWTKSGPSGTGLQFLSAEFGWIQDKGFWHTTDGGLTWKGPRDEPCFGGYGFFFLEQHHAWAVSGLTKDTGDGERSSVGKVVMTKDGGQTCIDIAQIPGQNLWSVFFLNEREGWVGGIGTLLKTKDGGHTWSKSR